MDGFKNDTLEALCQLACGNSSSAQKYSLREAGVCNSVYVLRLCSSSAGCPPGLH